MSGLSILGWLFIMVYSSAYYLMDKEYRPLSVMGVIVGLILFFGGQQ